MFYPISQSDPEVKLLKNGVENSDLAQNIILFTLLIFKVFVQKSSQHFKFLLLLSKKL
jgi:hypothetical protein